MLERECVGGALDGKAVRAIHGQTGYDYYEKQADGRIAVEHYVLVGLRFVFVGRDVVAMRLHGLPRRMTERRRQWVG